MDVRCSRGGALAAADARDGSLVVIRHRQYSLQEQISHAIRPRALGRDMGGVRGRAAVSGWRVSRRDGTMVMCGLQKEMTWWEREYASARGRHPPHGPPNAREEKNTLL